MLSPLAQIDPARPEAHSLWEATVAGMRSTFEQTTWRGWLMLLVSIFVGFVLGHVVRALLRRVAKRLHARKREIRAVAFDSAAAPSALFLLVAGVAVGLAGVKMSPAVQWFVARVLALASIFVIGWFLFNLIDVIDLTLRRYARRTKNNLDDQMVPLVRKTLRLFLVIVLVLFTMENIFERDVTAWVTGLGIVGLAVTLAAQDSLKNLFGSITILLDRPFQLGDSVVIDGQDGQVEDIGFRSTRLRRPDGSVTTIPNSKVVDQSIQNMNRRRTQRRIFDIGIAIDTPPEKVEQLLASLRALLSEGRFATAFDMQGAPPRVYFDDIREGRFNLKIMYWFNSTDGTAFQEHAEALNLAILRTMQEIGVSMARPTQTVVLQKPIDETPPSSSPASP